MTTKQIKEMVQGWIDDLSAGGFDIAGLPDEMRQKLEKMDTKMWNAYFDGQIDALQSVVNSL